MIIVIPMAGAGSRFPKSEYPNHKSLIEFNGKTLLEYSLRSLPFKKSKCVIFIVLTSQIDPQMERLISKLCGSTPFEILSLDNPTRGQAETVHLALKNVSLAEELLIHNCDTAMNVDWEIERRSGGVIFTFESDSDAFSYAKVDNRGYVIQVAEKRVISEFASSGTYWFSSVGLYEECYARQSNNNTYSELFVAPLYQELINEGIDVKIQQCEEVFPLGTPKDLEQSTCKIHMWKPQW